MLYVTIPSAPCSIISNGAILSNADFVIAYPTPQPPDPIFPGGLVNAVAEIIFTTVAPPCLMNSGSK